ncbi:MAG: HEAT repeat domain-containing protein [Planctomycetes bacterium]|nr:HEAT repeat domain-containing protein [Planctomycetota bacterium]
MARRFRFAVLAAACAALGLFALSFRNGSGASLSLDEDERSPAGGSGTGSAPIGLFGSRGSRNPARADSRPADSEGAQTPRPRIGSTGTLPRRYSKGWRWNPPAGSPDAHDLSLRASEAAARADWNEVTNLLAFLLSLDAPTDVLAALLASPDEELRALAASSFSGSGRPELAPALLAATECDPSPAVRAVAARAASRLDPPAARERQRALQATDADHGVRATAAQCLASDYGPGTGEALVAAFLGDPDSTVIEAAAGALVGRDREALTAVLLEEALNGRLDGSREGRAWEIVQAALPSEEVLPALRAAAAAASDDETRRRIAILLGRTLDPDVQPDLVELYRASEDSLLRSLVRRSLASIGKTKPRELTPGTSASARPR